VSPQILSCLGQHPRAPITCSYYERSQKRFKKTGKTRRCYPLQRRHGISSVRTEAWLRHLAIVWPDKLRPGRPGSNSAEPTLSRKPTAGAHWIVRQAAQASGISKSTVHRLFQTFAVQPHRTAASNSPPIRSSSKKVRDIVGLYVPTLSLYSSRKMLLAASAVVRSSLITSKPANDYQFKTGQRNLGQICY